MLAKKIWINNQWVRVLQHLLFWMLSFYAFLYVFKIGGRPERIDYIYTALFHATILPPVYVNLELLLPKQNKLKRWWLYISSLIIIILFFSWFNYSFFEKWSNTVLPDYFFISYFTFWQVSLFFVLYLSLTSLLKLSRSWFVVNELQKELLIMEKQRAEFELKALRAQMNPHFIFNCLNSIKSLIQQKEENKAVGYLTTFSKLLRTILQNYDREISLFDEIETCRLYLELESMRFDTRVTYAVHIDESLDLKSVTISALVVQPFIENAIWHGIAPKGTCGHVSLSVSQGDNGIEIVVEDDGIGREASQQNKSASGLIHQSKGVNLTQSRLELDNLLQQRQMKLGIIDKRDENGKATGTKVIITITEEQ